MYDIKDLPLCRNSKYDTVASVLWLIFSLGILVKLMDHKTRAKFRLEPCGLGRHDVATVGNIHQLLHGYGIESERHGHFARVNSAFQFAEPADSTDEIDALIRTEIGDAEDVAENKVARDCHVQHTYGVIVIVGSGLRGQ